MRCSVCRSPLSVDEVETLPLSATDLVCKACQDAERRTREQRVREPFVAVPHFRHGRFIGCYMPARSASMPRDAEGTNKKTGQANVTQPPTDQNSASTLPEPPKHPEALGRLSVRPEARRSRLSMREVVELNR